MHSKFILAISIVLIVDSTSAAIHSLLEGGRTHSTLSEEKILVIDDKALAAYVEKNIQQIEKVAASSGLVKNKLDFIQDRVQRISDYRTRNWSKSAFVEQQLDLAIKPFESFPKSSEFQSNRCKQYLNNIIVDWEPGSSETGPKQAGVARAFKILSDICR